MNSTRRQSIFITKSNVTSSAHLRLAFCAKIELNTDIGRARRMIKFCEVNPSKRNKNKLKTKKKKRDDIFL